MKIALDPYMMRRVPLTDLPGLVADLGYEYLELSPRDDFLPFFLHPRADRAQIAAFRGALSAAGVQVCSVLPLYRWSGPGEDERQAAVRWYIVNPPRSPARESSVHNLGQVRAYLAKYGGAAG